MLLNEGQGSVGKEDEVKKNKEKRIKTKFLRKEN